MCHSSYSIADTHKATAQDGERSTVPRIKLSRNFAALRRIKCRTLFSLLSFVCVLMNRKHSYVQYTRTERPQLMIHEFFFQKLCQSCVKRWPSRVSSTLRLEILPSSSPVYGKRVQQLNSKEFANLALRTCFQYQIVLFCCARLIHGEKNLCKVQ